MVLGAMRLLVSVSRLHIIAIAMMGTFTFGWLFTGRYLWLMTAICGIDWFVVNLLNRVVDIKEDAANEVVGTGFVENHRGALFALGLGCLLVSLVCTHIFVPEITILRVAFQLLGFAYNWRLLPNGRRIKELYFFKNTSSALGFLITVFGYPLVTAMDSPFPAGVSLATVIVSGVFFMLFELSYEAIYDLRDAPGDALAGVRTYAVVHGDAGAVRIIDTLIIVSGLTLLVGYSAGIVPWRIFVMVIAPMLQFVLYKRAHARGLTSGDCVRLTWIGAALLLAYHLWVVAGLPGVVI